MLSRLVVLTGVVWLAGCQPGPEQESGFRYQREHQVDLTGDGNPEILVLTATGPTPEGLVIDFTIRSGDSVLFSASWDGAGYFAYDLPSDSATQEERFTRIVTRLDEFFDSSAFAELDPTAPRFAPAEGGEPVALISSALIQPRMIDSLIAGGADSATARSAAWEATWSTGFIHPDARRFWEDMTQLRPMTFRFFSGGEYNRQIAWSANARRFFSIWECC